MFNKNFNFKEMMASLKKEKKEALTEGDAFANKSVQDIRKELLEKTKFWNSLLKNAPGSFTNVHKVINEFNQILKPIQKRMKRLEKIGDI